MHTRRDFVRDAACLGAASIALPQVAGASTNGDHSMNSLPAPPDGTPESVAQDEAYWRSVAEQYRVTEGVSNLEAGFFGMMARPVLNAFHRNIDRANRDSSYFARREYPAIYEDVRKRVATFIGAKPNEIVFSRNATEALQALIGQYRGLSSRDTIMYADIDYNAMQWSMNALAARTGAKLVTFAVPERASRAALVESYRVALDSNPATKLLLLTHCNNKSGLLLPVKDIVDIAKPRGIDVIVDAAHSFGQVPLTVDELGADFVGLNLHKWIGAPVGAGVMYIRESRVDAIDRAHADESGPPTSIDTRLHTGTSNFATIMTVPDALDFQASIGMERKAARLRYLRDRWVNAVRDVRGVDILTPDDAGLVGALTSFRLHGRGDRASNATVARTLLEEFRVFTTTRSGLAKGECVRVTPALYSSVEDADKLAAAIRVLVARG